MKKLSILILFFFVFDGISQTKRGNIWYFGNQAGLNFNGGAPTPLLNSQMSTLEGCASIADRYGRLLFYTDGVKVYNACHQVMPNGDSLLGDPSSVTSAVITPVIGDSMRYYIFTVDGISSCTNGLCAGPKGAWDGLNYSIVDMCLNNGKGDIVPGAKNIPIVDTTAEMIATIKHTNGTDYWIVTQRLDAYYAYLVTPSGVAATPVLSYVIPAPSAWPGGQRLVPSHDGKLLLHVGGPSSIMWGAAYLFNFDKVTGILTPNDTLARRMGTVSAEFSPDDSTIYLGRMFAFGMMVRPKIMTYKRYAPKINATEDSIATPGPMDVPSDMRIGPDQKIYIKNSTSTTAVTVMNNPNNRNSPGITWNSLSLGGRTMSSWLPNYFNYFNEDTSWVPANENLPYAGTDKSDTCGVNVTLGIPYRNCHSYRWSPGSNLNDSTLAQPTAYSAGTYIVTVTHKCETYIDTTIVTNNSNFVPVNITGNNIVCAGQTAYLTANGGTGSYSWSNGATTSSVSIFPTGSTMYYATSVNGACSSADSVLVANSPALNINITGGGTLCMGSSISLSPSVTGGTGSTYTYLWTPGNYSGQNLNVSPTTSVQYILSVTDSLGCRNTDTVDINIAGKPTMNVVATTSLTCFGSNNGSATLNTSGGTGPYTYSWAPGAYTANTITGLSQGVYIIVAADSIGCTDTLSITINEPPQLVSILSSTLSACGLGNGSAVIMPGGGSGSYTYNWSNGTTVSLATGLSAVTYTVQLSDANGCSIDTNITIYELPPPTATVSASVTIKQGESVNLNAAGGSTYQWYPTKGLSCTNCANPVARPDSSRTYCVVVYDAGLCSDTSCVTINVEAECSGELFVPNAFSPNADGQNDILYVKGACIDKMLFSVFNRWGQKVFETTDVAVGWDGNFKSSRENREVFVYKLLASLKNGEEISKQGNISLIR